MTYFSPYLKSRIINYGINNCSEKDANVSRLQNEYSKTMSMSLEYVPDATINGIEQRIIARKTQGSQRYEIQSYPGETFHAGDIVECYDSIWIIIEVNANKEIYTTGIMLRCNHLFRFQNGTSKIHERWGVLDTGVYSTTVKETETQTRLNKQYKIYLPLDDETKKIFIGKRLAVGVMKDSDYNDVLIVYRTTEFDNLSENYGEDALLVLKCISDPYDQRRDNVEHMICDYIAPDEPEPPVQTDFYTTIQYTGEPVVRIGGTGKTFTASYADENGHAVSGVTTSWSLGSAPSGVSLRTFDDGSCKVVVGANVPDATLFTLIATGTKDAVSVSDEIVIEAVYT